MSQEKFNLCIIGARHIGRVHAETLAFRLPEASLLSITDIDVEAARTAAAHCAIPTVSSSREELLAYFPLDVVLFFSSTETHASLIVQAAEVGKHVFYEKRMAHSLGVIDHALKAAKRAGVKC